MSYISDTLIGSEDRATFAVVNIVLLIWMDGFGSACWEAEPPVQPGAHATVLLEKTVSKFD